MKKILSMVLFIAIIFVFTACESLESVETDNSAMPENSQTSEGSAPEPVKEGYWVEKYYVDEFDEPTDERYIANKEYIEGVFSNFATNDSDLTVKFAIDEEKVGIFLYEYDDFDLQVKSIGNYKTDYTIYVRNESGNEKLIKGTMYGGGDRICIEDEEKDTFIDYLCGEEDFKVYIVSDEDNNTEYLFEVSPSNFSEIY